MASAYRDCSDRDFKSESAAEEGPLDSEDSTWGKSPSAVSSPLYYPDSEDDGCSGDSGGFVRTEGLDNVPETHRLLASPSASRGAGVGVSSNTDGQDSASNSFPRMVDSPDTEWTDEKHSSYLDSIEASFVKKMYDKEYCALDLCGQAPKEPENLDPDSAESRLNFPSPFNEFKVWQKGCWQKPPYLDKCQQSAVPTVLGSPWVQHFRKLVSSNKRAVPLSSVNESWSSGAQKGAVMLKHPANTSTDIEKAPNVGQRTFAWHHRLQQSNCTSFPSICGKRELSAVYDKKFIVSATAITDQNIDDEVKVERSRGNNLLGMDHNFEGNARGEKNSKNSKNLKVNVDGGCSSSKDQVVPLLGSEAGDCNYTSKVQGFSADTDQQFNDAINSSSATIKNRTSFLKHKKL